MSKRRKKQAAPVRHLSTAPLPARLMPGFSDLPLVFTDASRLRHGGLSAVLYADAAGEPLTFTRSVPLDGSNELDNIAASLSAAYNIGAHTFTLAYQKVSGDGDYAYGVDGGGTIFLANSVARSDFNAEDEKSWQARYDINMATFGVPGLTAPSLPVIGGDGTAACIAAASVIAKVTRDRIMVDLDRDLPGYDFALHKGYSTAHHMSCIDRLGPSREHRMSYRNVAARAGGRPPITADPDRDTLTG